MLVNRPRADRMMAESGLDAIVASGWTNIFYLTEYATWIDPLFREYMIRPGGSIWPAQAFAVLPRGGDPLLIVGPVFASNATAIEPARLYTFGAFPLDHGRAGAASPEDRALLERLEDCGRFDSPVAALTAALKDRGLALDRIGLEHEGLTPPTLGQLEEVFPGQRIRDCSNFMRVLRMIKTPEELARLSHAAWIAENAVIAMLGEVTAANTMEELKNAFHSRVAARGADFDHFAYSVRGLGIATEAPHRVGDSAMTYFDYGCKFKGYYSDSGMTIASRAVDPAMAGLYESLHGAIEAGLAVMRPGVASSHVRLAMSDFLLGQGLELGFPHGHGLGLDVRDYPILVDRTGLRLADDCIDLDADLPLEADMALNLETSIFVAGYGSMNIEVSYRVTADGVEPLMEHDWSRPHLIGERSDA